MKYVDCANKMKKEGNVAQFTSPCIFQKNVGTEHHFYLQKKKQSKSLADLGGASPGQKFHHFHAVLRKNWPNNRLAGPPIGLVPPSGKSWIHH